MSVRPLESTLQPTQYDDSHPWQDGYYAYRAPYWNNASDRVAYERIFAQGSFEDRQIAQAMITQNPLTPNSEIAEKMTVHTVPPKFGYNDTEITINDVVQNDFTDDHLFDRHTTEFSDRRSGVESTTIPSLPNW